MPFKLILTGLLLLLVGCGTLPRGAGLEREVLANSSKTVAGTATPDSPGVPLEFAVEPITRSGLARFAAWPVVGARPMSWTGRVDRPNSRIIAPGDMVAISIWSTEDNGLLTSPGQRFVTLPPNQVSPSGEIFLPYIGQIKVSGLSPEQARSKVEQDYAAVSPSAQVLLDLAEGRQSTASVIGGVAKPGVYPLADQDVTLLEVIAQAGGVAPNLVNPQIRLQRGDRTYGIAVSSILADTSLNTTLQGGDRLFVEDDRRFFLSLGAAGSEAQHRFPQARVTALDAMSLIGGLSADRANAQGILILRTYPDSAVRRDGSGPRHVRTIFTIDLTSADGLFSAGQFDINPGDLIYVTESPLIGTRNIFSVIGSVFGLANTVGNATN